MTKTLSRYLARLFFARLILLAVGINLLVVLLDFISESDDVLKGAEQPLWAAVRYMGLRLPEIASTLLPFVLLMAVLLSLIELVRRREIVAMMSAGMSQAGIMLTLLPAGLVVALVQLALDDQLAPRATKELREWGVGEYAKKDDVADVVWFRYRGDILRVRYIEKSGTMRDVTIFRRGENDAIVERISADSLEFGGDGWMLHYVRRSTVDGPELQILDHLAWDSNLTPNVVESLASHPSELSFGDLFRFQSELRFGSFPRHVYVVWLNRKIAAPFILVVMVLLCVPLIQRYQRQANIVLILSAGFGIGFLFIVTDDFLVTLGEAGVLPAAISAWAATAFFAAVGATLAFYRELH